jgi:hypothetical protein
MFPGKHIMRRWTEQDEAKILQEANGVVFTPRGLHVSGETKGELSRTWAAGISIVGGGIHLRQALS